MYEGGNSIWRVRPAGCREVRVRAPLPNRGEMAERFNAAVLKTADPARDPKVRILVSPQTLGVITRRLRGSKLSDMIIVYGGTVNWSTAYAGKRDQD